MKYTALAVTAAGLVAAVAAGQPDAKAWTPATQTKPPVAGFTLRPTPAVRLPRAGLNLRNDNHNNNNNDNDNDDDDEDDRAGKITHGTVAATGSSSGSSTNAPRPSNTCGWDQNGGGFYACADAKATCRYSNDVVGCCTGDNCKKIPKKCVAQSNNCDSDDNGGTLCCRQASAPACYTWLIPTSTDGKQSTFSMFACTDKAGTGTLLPTDPASASTTTTSSSTAGGGKSNIGAIVGGVIGGLLGLLAIALFIWYVLRQRRRGRAENAAAAAARDGDEKPAAQTYADVYGAVPRRKAVPSGTEETLLRDRSVTTSSGGGWSAAAREGTASPQEHLAYSVSSGSTAGTGVVSSLSSAPPPLAGVVEAPDTAVANTADSPVEVPGTTVTRESMHSRAELA
ncbi:hypothetical protein CCM_07889 [Cordyceps militaris CM01]|uniref:Uncharacterized protein n=1 Tax=Cordyceps militaris (strain CM01) TaxID=983644 RepID=G3JP27_CORMM|nr:uncharacterized protein CCM_07889 [Cordyceps militaris CM01]EGX89637.1 hypothetical protein CCM_07889 [Cordyceps militaris CM01]